MKLVITAGVRGDNWMTPTVGEGAMDFGNKPAFDGKMTPSDTALPIAWFERSSTEHPSSADRGLSDNGGLLDRLRETGGLVYGGDGEDEL